MNRIDPVKTATVSQRFPELCAVPESERLPLLLQARRPPAVLATFFGLLLVWMRFCASAVISVTGHLHGRALLVRLILPVVVPVFVIFWVSRQVLRRTILRLIAQHPATPPTPPAHLPQQ